ncbi:hypothetical protein EDD11_006339 [Mortierella claussenii]|nr:hypothetical protein EDD11_006339 [Mortierella claussenii]
MDMATELSTVNFVGVDISPIYPTAIYPRNCNFYNEDFLQGVSQPNNAFDVVFQRNVTCGFTFEHWQKVMKEAFRILKPGGYYECVESDVTIQNAGPQTNLVFEHLRVSMAAKNVDPSIVRSLDRLLAATGFTDVHVKEYSVPVGEWGGKVGVLWKQNMFQILETVRPHLAAAARISEAQVQEVVNAMHQEISTFRSYQIVYVAYARKPLAMELLDKAQSLLQECINIIASLDAWKNANASLEIDGMQKMISALHSEQKFLEKVVATPADEIKTVQITSSNVPYLKSLAWTLIHSKNPVAVRKVFTYKLDPFTAIDPSEKFKALPENNGQKNIKSATPITTTSTTKGGKGSRSIMQLTTSRSLSADLKNEQVFQVKVDVVADHGRSWLRINAGSVWSLAHEFAGMEDDSDDDDDQDDEEEEEEEDSKEDDINNNTTRTSTRRRKPIHVSKNTHPDMALLTRSLVLAADQNRLHYNHAPNVTLRFAGILPDESPALEAMIHTSVRVGRVAQSVSDGTIIEFPVQVALGPVTSSTVPEDASRCKSVTPTDPAFAPFTIPVAVDDMELFTSTLHLDITTLMALSSFLCHTIRPDPGLFVSPPLVLQAQQEHEQPLLPLLAKIFESRERLVISRTAATRFKSILDVIGGPEEQWRGRVMIHDPLEERGDKAQEDERLDSIRERWVRGSDWAQRYGVFVSGPPRIEVIEDILVPPPNGSLKVHDQLSQGRQDVDSKQPLEEKKKEEGDQKEEEIEQHSIRSDGTESSGVGRKELNVTELHIRIFSTGYHARLTTITANQVGYRTVIRMGHVPSGMSVWNHSPRSLAEAKLPAGRVVLSSDESKHA